MNYKHLQVEIIDEVMIITINREDKMNALNLELLHELNKVVWDLFYNKTVKGAVITGKGEKAFAAGADIGEFTSLDFHTAAKMSKEGQDIFNSIERCPKPVVAAINGYALGGGCELAMACHMRIAGETAKFGLPEVNLGIIPGYGGTQRLAQLVGKGRAFELILTGKMINSAEAYRIGLVNQLGHNETLVVDAMDIIHTISGKAPLAIAKAIKSINAGYEMRVDGYAVEANEFASSTTTKDFKEGAAAFIEKRKPNFTGE